LPEACHFLSGSSPEAFRVYAFLFDKFDFLHEPTFFFVLVAPVAEEIPLVFPMDMDGGSLERTNEKSFTLARQWQK
jgi:hypothetical protein